MRIFLCIRDYRGNIMKKLLSILLVSSAMYGSESSSSSSASTPAASATATTVNNGSAYIYFQLVANGVNHHNAVQQAQEWHPPLLIPFGPQHPNNR